MQIMRSNF